MAARYCFADCVELLARAGANKEAVDGVPGRTALSLDVSQFFDPSSIPAAVERTAEALIRFEANVNVHEPITFRSPLHYATTLESPRLMQLLLSRGANPNIADCHGQTPLHFASQHVRGCERTRVLLDAGADPNISDHNGLTPLHLLAEVNAVAVMELLLKAGAGQDGNPPFNGATGVEEPPLVRAAKANAVDRVRLLLDAGASTVAFDSLLHLFSEEVHNIRRDHKQALAAQREVEAEKEAPSISQAEERQDRPHNVSSTALQIKPSASITGDDATAQL